MPGAEHIDVVVIGAGAAGCVVAGRLAETGEISVVLLEAGPDLRPELSPQLVDGWRLTREIDQVRVSAWRTQSLLS